MTDFLTKRQSVLFGEIEKGGSFADVGCDHGYIAEAVLYSKLCDKVIISDVSEKCLKKADDRLKARYSGQYEAIVSDGFDSLPMVDQAVVAGMGGRLIASFLTRRTFTPKRLVLQPMKHSEELRRMLIVSGYGIVRDYTIEDGGKFYDVIVAEKGVTTEAYTADELAFGRDNLKEKSDDFKKLIESKIKVFEEAVANAKDGDKAMLTARLEKYKEIII